MDSKHVREKLFDPKKKISHPQTPQTEGINVSLHYAHTHGSLLRSQCSPVTKTGLKLCVLETDSLFQNPLTLTFDASHC